MSRFTLLLFTLFLTFSSVAPELNICAPEQIEASFPDQPNFLMAAQLFNPIHLSTLHILLVDTR